MYNQYKVNSLENDFSEKDIGRKFNLRNNIRNEIDEVTIISKLKGFGIQFFSKIYQKTFYQRSKRKLCPSGRR